MDSLQSFIESITSNKDEQDLLHKVIPHIDWEYEKRFNEDSPNYTPSTESDFLRFWMHIHACRHCYEAMAGLVAADDASSLERRTPTRERWIETLENYRENGAEGFG